MRGQGVGISRILTSRLTSLEQERTCAKARRAKVHLPHLSPAVEHVLDCEAASKTLQVMCKIIAHSLLLPCNRLCTGSVAPPVCGMGCRGCQNEKSAMPQPKLLDQVRTTAALRHLSPRTTEAYAHWIKRFILFHNKRHPVEMGAPDVRVFLSHLATSLKVSASTQNQALNALAFLYHQVLQRELGEIGEIPRTKRPKNLPVVFPPAEVRNVLNNLTGTQHLMASLLYGSGLRLTECIRNQAVEQNLAGCRP